MKIIQKIPKVYEPSSFTGWLIIPPLMDRSQYITKCYETGTITVKSVDNKIQNFVQVNKGDIHFLVFPPDQNSSGSAVACTTDPIYRTSKVVCILQDEDDEALISEENQWHIRKKNGESFVDLDAKGNSGELNITVNNGGNNGVSSNLKFLSKTNNSKLNVLIQGDLEVDVDNTIAISVEKSFSVVVQDNDNDGEATTIKYEAGTGFTFTDEFGNTIQTSDGTINIQTQNGETITLENAGLTIKTSNEDLKAIISDTLDAIVNLVVTTYSGPGFLSPASTQQVEQIKQRLTNLFK